VNLGKRCLTRWDNPLKAKAEGKFIFPADSTHIPLCQVSGWMDRVEDSLLSAEERQHSMGDFGASNTPFSRATVPGKSMPLYIPGKLENSVLGATVGFANVKQHFGWWSGLGAANQSQWPQARRKYVAEALAQSLRC
jgi:hypothetical protein